MAIKRLNSSLSRKSLSIEFKVWQNLHPCFFHSFFHVLSFSYSLFHPLSFVLSLSCLLSFILFYPSFVPLSSLFHPFLSSSLFHLMCQNLPFPHHFTPLSFFQYYFLLLLPPWFLYHETCVTRFDFIDWLDLKTNKTWMKRDFIFI